MADDHQEIELFFVTRLLSLAALFSVGASIIGQQVGVSLQLNGQTIPNNSLVDLEEFLYNPPQDPTNDNGLQTLMCVTDRVECCETPALGSWYYPNGNRIEVNITMNRLNQRFLSNRGQNEVINGQQFYGSVRFWRRWTPPERGIFRCELPDTHGVNQSLYVNILFFNGTMGELPVLISFYGSSIAGETYFLICSATLYPNRNPPLPDPSIPSPTFEWFYGPDGNASLPSGLTPGATTLNGSTYASKLEFSPLHQSHTGNYTCRLGAGNLTRNIIISTVTVPSISATITANLRATLEVGQTGNTLICEVTGAEKLSPTITYNWTRNSKTISKSDGNSKTLNFSPLRLSHAGSYACNVNVSSALLSSTISASSHKNENVTIQIPDPQSVTLTSSNVLDGADVTINCNVKFSQSVTESELSLLVVDIQLSRKEVGTMKNLSDSYPTISGATLIYTTVVNSFSRSDSGNYSCVGTIRPHPNLEQPSSFYLYGIGKLVSNQTRVTTGVFISSRSSIINTNSNIFITDIGEGDCGALLCYTDLNECCHNSDTTTGALGQWFYPNGSVVGTWSSEQDFYVDRGPSVVRLNRRTDASSITGMFCCEVPDATSTKTKICTNVIDPQSKRQQIVTCTTEVAIGAAVAVVATVIVECLIIGAPITVVLLCKLCLKKRKCDSRLAVREFNEKDNHELSNKAATASNAVRGCGAKEIIYIEPDLNETAMSKSVSMQQDDGDYEVMLSTYTMMQGNENIYAVPDIATTTRGRGLGRKEDTYDEYVQCNAVNTPAITAMQPRGGERENGLQLYEDPDNPGHTTSLRGKFRLH